MPTLRISPKLKKTKKEMPEYDVEDTTTRGKKPKPKKARKNPKKRSY